MATARDSESCLVGVVDIERSRDIFSGLHVVEKMGSFEGIKNERK